MNAGELEELRLADKPWTKCETPHCQNFTKNRWCWVCTEAVVEAVWEL